MRISCKTSLEASVVTHILVIHFRCTALVGIKQNYCGIAWIYSIHKANWRDMCNAEPEYGCTNNTISSSFLNPFFISNFSALPPLWLTWCVFMVSSDAIVLDNEDKIQGLPRKLLYNRSRSFGNRIVQYRAMISDAIKPAPIWWQIRKSQAFRRLQTLTVAITRVDSL